MNNNTKENIFGKLLKSDTWFLVAVVLFYLWDTVYIPEFNSMFGVVGKLIVLEVFIVVFFILGIINPISYFIEYKKTKTTFSYEVLFFFFTIIPLICVGISVYLFIV